MGVRIEHPQSFIDGAQYGEDAGHPRLPVADYALTYTIRTRVLDREQENFDWNMHVLLKYASAGKDKEYEEIRARYTGLSETIEPFVAELVEEITAGCEDDYDKALAIENWIRDNCTYTQTPGDAPGDRDFLSYFLETIRVVTQQELEKADLPPVFPDQAFFHEFVTSLPRQEEVLAALEQNGILGGLPVEGGVLWCATEKQSKAELDKAIALVKEVLAK